MSRRRARLALLACLAPALPAAPALAQSETFAADTVAEAVRAGGHACTRALSAEREVAQDRPDEQVWRLTCPEHSYRVRFMGDEGPRIEPLDGG